MPGDFSSGKEDGLSRARLNQCEVIRPLVAERFAELRLAGIAELLPRLLR
jgi:hypothetical protein